QRLIRNFNHRPAETETPRFALLGTFLFSVERRSRLADAWPGTDLYLQVPLLAFAHDGQCDRLAGRQRGNLVQEADGIINRLAIELQHDIAHANTRAPCRTVAQDAGNDYSVALFQIKGPGQIGRDVLGFYPQPAPGYRAGLDDLIHDGVRGLGRDGEPYAQRSTRL